MMAWRRGSGVPTMASQAFMSRFSTTCCIWTRSASTVGNAGIQVQGGQHVARDEFAVRELERLAHHVVELHRRILRVALAQQRAQPLDHLRGAFVVLHDVLQDFAELVLVGAALLQHAERRLGVAEDRSQRLLELVGKRARELAEHRGARQVRELLALVARIRLGALARGDVGARDHRAAFGATQALEADLHPAGVADIGLAAFDDAAIVGAVEHDAQGRTGVRWRSGRPVRRRARSIAGSSRRPARDRNVMAARSRRSSATSR